MILLNVQSSDLPIVIREQIKEKKLFCADTGVVLTPDTVSVWGNEYISKEAFRMRTETLDALAQSNEINGL